MELDFKMAMDVLLDKGVNNVHHANSVLTSCTFLRRMQLVSRGAMELNGYPQSYQISDSQDKRFGLYFDLFLDSVDIHARAKKNNAYGPVLFVINAAKLVEMDVPSVWITKSNPLHWRDTDDHSEKWFTSIDELENDFVVGRFDQMIVLRSVGGVLPISNCLRKVIIDDPKIEIKTSVSVYGLSLGALFVSLRESGNTRKRVFNKRSCPNDCTCLNEYNRMDAAEFKKLFFPY